MSRSLQPNQIEEARRMREAGQSWRAIGRAFSVREDTVMAAVDPIFAERRREKLRQWRVINGRSIGAARKPYVERPDPDRIPAVPRDTRGLTAWICGDPLPGRSALDQRRGVLT